ncbi:tRNA (guanosine(46)-N7)-methyltransferase TrmB [Robiginitomaculum antarcticum]|uniref:tRNA (guanosine(46)-N7)-methyltransferase TrmB n=1 Tax=Robiginitomaculum antarcticum TaxID=437507 RepID=UPI00037A6F71|nr:tRNA (guanosine(46)-N7)-methyltransferase TrmB [Robiginitomaculum antarcticum]
MSALAQIPDTANRLYGRAKGKPLSAYQSGLIETLLPDISVSVDAPLYGLEQFDSRYLEIGFGAAEHILHRASENPRNAYIGAEPFLNGVAKACAGIDRGGLDNIRLYHGDVRDLFPAMGRHSLDGMYILFPDPWPKSRHNKRRIMSKEFITQIHGLIKPGGFLCFASDILDYVDWTLTRIDAHSGFGFSPDSKADFLTPYTGWPGTRYQKKATREGRIPHYFTFTAQ